MAQTPLDEKKVLELQIFDDIKYIYDSNAVLDDLGTLEDLTEVLDEISLLNKQYRHVHVELKFLMGDDYADAYKEYDQRLEGMKKFISSVKKRIKTLNSSKVESDKNNLTSALKIEEGIFRERFDKELVEFRLDNVVEIRENCSKLEALLQEYYRLFSKAKIGLAGDFEAVFAKTFDDMITLIRDKIDEGKKAVAKSNQIWRRTLRRRKPSTSRSCKNSF